MEDDSRTLLGTETWAYLISEWATLLIPAARIIVVNSVERLHIRHALRRHRDRDFQLRQLRVTISDFFLEEVKIVKSAIADNIAFIVKAAIATVGALAVVLTNFAARVAKWNANDGRLLGFLGRRCGLGCGRSWSWSGWSIRVVVSTSPVTACGCATADV